MQIASLVWTQSTSSVYAILAQKDQNYAVRWNNSHGDRLLFVMIITWLIFFIIGMLIFSQRAFYTIYTAETSLLNTIIHVNINQPCPH